MAGKTWTGRLVLKGEKKGVKGAFGGASKNVDGLSSSLKKLGAVAGAAVLGKVLLDTANVIRNFEKSISDLSAITGATGADLDRLADASKRIGQTTTLSASQAAEAFKLMASAKPDLLANLDALEATTLAAVTLAEAAGIELPAATAALGESLNQFGASAEEAGRFINVLAAGAKFGASEIEDTAAALKNAGTVASLAGLSFEETNAALQGLAAGGIKGSKAGEKLKSVLIRLQVQADDRFNPAIHGLSTVLDNLAEANLSVTEKVKIFGIEAVSTADLLVQQRETIATVTEKITGSNEAYEQAEKRTDNLDGSIKQLSSAFEAVQLSFSGAAGGMRVVVDFATDMLNIFASLNSDSDEGSISVASVLFDGLAFSLKTTFTAGIVLKNMFDNIVAVLGFVGKSLASLIVGDFDLLDDHLRDMVAAIDANEQDIGDAVAGIWNPELAAEVRENMRQFSLVPAVEVAQETAKAVALVATTAGEEARLAAAAQAEKDRIKVEEKEAKRIEAMREANRSQMEVAADLFAEKLAQNIELLELEIITELQFDERRIENARILHATLLAMNAAAAKRNLTFATMTSKQQTSAVLGEAVRLTQGVATSNKVLFNINKAAALAGAIVAMPAHISETMSKYPYPISIAMGALAAVSSLAQISAIKSAKFSGGGTGTTPSAAGSVPTINSIPLSGQGGGIGPLDVGAGGSPGPGTVVTIELQGLDDAGLLTAEQVRALMESISEQLGDGVTIDTGG